jgi:two-component system LytT family response regulator
MRCIIVDDEKWGLDLLEDNLRHVPYLELVSRCKNAREASAVLHAQPLDLIFLDVQMPGLSGLQFIQTLPEPPLVVLVTAYEQYALEGFNLSVVDYLLKPVALERFIKACNKAKSIYDLNSAPGRTKGDHLFVNVEYSLVKISFDDITYVEGLKDYIRIHLTSSQKPVLTRMSMKAMEEKLPADRFVRAHKSFIVAIGKVTSVKRDFICIQDVEIPVGESFKDCIRVITGIQK